MIPFLRTLSFKIALLLIGFIAIPTAQKLSAQVRFSAICPEKKIGNEDLLQIQFKIENANYVESIIPPAFKNFKVVAGPNQQSGMTSINGKIDQYISISFFLKPLSTGKFTISPAVAIADGKKFSTKPIHIEVIDGSTSSSGNLPQASLSPFQNFNFDLPPRPTHQFEDYILKEGESAEKKTRKNLFVKLDISKNDCYVGEAITASYKLYTRLRSESTITNAPSFNGFSVSDLDVNDHVSIEKYKGRPYNVYVLRKVQLYPMHEGEITLAPLITENKVTFLRSDYVGRQGRDMFFELFENFADATTPQNEVVDKTVTLKSEPVVIEVKPLPAKNVPANFKGTVGNYTISASLKKDKITTDDEGVLQLTISGEGNIQMVNAPEIMWPEGIDGFDAKVKGSINKNVVPMAGSKTFSYPFIVDKPGNYTLDSISFSYFDPATSGYKTVKTNALNIQVEKGKGTPVSSLVKDQKNNNEQQSFLKKYSSALIIAVIVLVLSLLVIKIFKNKNKKLNQIIAPKKAEKENKRQEKEEEFVIPENALLPAHSKLKEGDSEGFYRVLDASLKKYLAGKFKIPIEQMSRKRLNEELDRCNVGLSTSLMLTKLQEEIELNLYARPTSENHLKNVFEKAGEVISLLDKQVCK